MINAYLLVLVSRTTHGRLTGRRLSDVHNGGNTLELRRIRSEHAGERECVVNDRVLGFLDPTRGEFLQTLSLSRLRRM